MNIIKYQPVIGLEVHVELKTKSKMFCSCKAEYFGEKPNSNTCPVCLGLPGTLPVPNKKAIDWCIMIGLALNCKIANFSKFDRKNYFYPDLPKGYQISQYDQPFAINGSLKLKIKNEKLKIYEEKIIKIRRVHMEEDTAKLIHQGENSLIDFNRSGVPLVEIVTEPDFENAQEVVGYLKKLQQVVRYLNVSDADMEKGNMRFEPNISLSKNTTNTTNKQILPIYKVEVKNINSFRFVDKAIEFEIKRQAEILNGGKIPTQETRGWDEDRQKTVSQRIKEEAQDYRYFPEPDIPPIRFTQDQISNLKSQMTEMPWDKAEKFIQFGLTTYQAQVSTATVERANFVEKALEYSQEQKVDPRGTVSYILNRRINDINTITPAQAVEEYRQQTSVIHIDEQKLNEVIKQVLTKNQKAVNDYKNGKEAAIMFLVGQVLRQFKEKIDANKVKEIFKKVLE